MNTRTISAIVCSVVILGAVGWMIYDGSQVNEVKTTRVKLQPDKAGPAESSQQNRVPDAKKDIQTGDKAVKIVPAEQSHLVLNKAKSEHTRFVIPQENLSHLYIVKCSACHGKDGNGPVGSSIAGKSYDYNLQKLRDYKNNKVENTMMADLLTRTPESELEQLAREVSAFKPRS